MDNNPLAYVHKSKLGASQIQLFSELALFDFAIKYWKGKSNKDVGTLSHCPLNPDSPQPAKVPLTSYEIPQDFI